MKKIISIILLLALEIPIATAQWSQKANLPSTARSRSASFMIGNKLYVVGGMNISNTPINDFWEYDITSDTWTQLPNFPGVPRFSAVAFTIGGKGYFGTGEDGSGTNFFDDMWEYDPVAATWTPKAAVPDYLFFAFGRAEAVGFSIGNKGYVGLGVGFEMPSSPVSYYDMYEFDPVLDTWTAKSEMPGSSRTMAVAVPIGNKAYVGLGTHGSNPVNYRSFFEFDPAADTWVARANFPTEFSVDAAAFTLNSKMYVVGGVDLSPLALSNKVYQYDPQANYWAALPNFNGGSIAGQFAVSNGSRAFVGTGFTGSLNTRNDLWELGTIVPPPPSTVVVDPHTPTNPPTPTVNTTGLSYYNYAQTTDVTLYPNPVVDKLSVSASQKIRSMEIYNAAGVLVYKELNYITSISGLKLDAGIYVVKINFENGKTATRKFIKSN